MSGSGQPQLLPESDREFLDSKAYTYEVQRAGDIYVLIRDFVLPEAYAPRTCTLMLKLPAGYPNANPDMFWTAPNIRLLGGAFPVATEVVETHMGQSWQRWSRHTNGWRAGVDNIQTKLRAVVSELAKGR
jgi:hypothetical protein